MRVYLDKNGQMIIKFREKEPFYFDEQWSDMEIELYEPIIDDKFRKTAVLINPYYSKDGDLVEIRIDYLQLNVSSKDVTSRFETETIIPDKLPWRKYIFTFGREKDYPKICSDRFVFDEDLFFESGRLIIERRDGREIGAKEIRNLRERFYRNAVEFLDGAFYEYGIESIYFNRKLYFWIVDEKYYPETLDEFRKYIPEMIEIIYGGGNIFEEQQIKVPINVTKNFEDFYVITAILNPHYYDQCIYFIAGVESFDHEIDLSFDDVVNICKKLKKDDFEKQEFVFYDILPDWGEEKGKLEEWAKEQKIEIKSIIRYIAEFYLKRAEMNDEEAKIDPETWNEIIMKIFD